MEHEKRFAGTPERLRRPDRLELLEVDKVLDLVLEGIEAETALDVGTGSGVFAEAFARRGLRVTGIDPNPEMISASQRYVPDGTFREGTMESIPAADKSFDVVFMGHVLHETDDLLGALREARRCARHRVAVLEWPYQVDDYRPPLAHRLKPQQIADAAREAGFSGIRQLRMAYMELTLLS